MAMESGHITFDAAILDAVSDDTRKSLDAFSRSIIHAEGVLKNYNTDFPSFVSGNVGDQDRMANIAEHSRLIFSMTWAKSVLLSQGIVRSVNNGNLLIAFHALRGYVELVAALRYTVKRIEPIINKASFAGEISDKELHQISGHLEILLHGGRFNWAAYFEKGAMAHVERKRLKRTKEEKKKYETRSLRISTCIADWSKEQPAAEFIYDYLCDLVHPNKGSNLIILKESDGKIMFDTSGKDVIGLHIFERIFPYAASLCIGAMRDYTLPFAALGKPDE